MVSKVKERFEMAIAGRNGCPDHGVGDLGLGAPARKHKLEQAGVLEYLDKAIQHSAVAIGLAEAALKKDDGDDQDGVIVVAAAR